MTDARARGPRRPDYPAADADRWARVDDYFASLLTPHDPVLDAVLAANAKAGLPAIDVAPVQGQWLNLMVRITGARRVLELGTLGGYSTICMARGLSEGARIATIESDPFHATIAGTNFERAGLADRIDQHVGKALDVLPTLKGPFDLIFIDADKPNNPHYLDWAIRLSRPGTVLIVDNVVRGGGIADPANRDPANRDPAVEGTRLMLEAMAADPRISATAIQTVGEKGWDGFAMAIIWPDVGSEERSQRS